MLSGLCPEIGKPVPVLSETVLKWWRFRPFGPVGVVICTQIEDGLLVAIPAF